MTEIQEPFESREPKRAPAAPTLSGGATTQLSRSPHSEAGNPLNERSQALDLSGGDSASPGNTSRTDSDRLAKHAEKLAESVQ